MIMKQVKILYTSVRADYNPKKKKTGKFMLYFSYLLGYTIHTVLRLNRAGHCAPGI